MSAEYQLSLPLLAPEEAESGARAQLEEARGQLGFVPNMYAAMANAPGVLSTYLHGYEHLRERSGFSPVEQEVVFLTISRENGCSYCMAAHSVIADQMSKVPAEVTEAIRAGREIPDSRLEALARFIRVMFHTRGHPRREDVEAFLAAGYEERQILDIVLALAVKTLSNYSNHLFHTPVDEAFAARRWGDEAA